MSSLQFLRVLVMVICLAAMGPSGASADCVVVDLGPPQGSFGSLANGINSSGEVVGVGVIGRNGGENPPYAFDGAVWRNGTVTAVGGFAAVAINDAGQVVGSSESGTFIWQSGRLSPLGLYLAAGGISASGQVVGSILYPAPVGNQAVLWQNGCVTVLGPGFATGINASGQIVGGTVAGPEILGTYKTVGSPGSHAFVWQNGTMTDLGPGYANAINASGQIVGTANGQAVLWQNSQKMILGPGIAEAINAVGQVVGGPTADPLEGPLGKPFLWQNGTLTDLDSLLPPNSGWTLLDASGINDAGQIIGTGFYHGVFEAFLLTPTQSPVPEPSTIALLICGGTIGLVGWMWQRKRDKTIASRWPRSLSP